MEPPPYRPPFADPVVRGEAAALRGAAGLAVSPPLHTLQLPPVALRGAAALAAVLPGQAALLGVADPGLAALFRLLVELLRLARRAAPGRGAADHDADADRAGAELEAVARLDVLARLRGDAVDLDAT